MSDHNMDQPCLKTGEPPEWVHEQPCSVTKDERHGRELRHLRKVLWRTGAYDLTPELTAEAEAVAEELSALLAFVERAADRWIALEHSIQQHFVDVPEHSDLSVPCSSNPTRRSAWKAMEALSDAVNYEYLSRASYIPECHQ